MSDPSASMLHRATIENAERNEISNSARDTFRFVQNNYNLNTEGENRVLELHDTIDFLLNVVPPFLEEVRKNDNSRSTVSETTGADGSDPLPQAVSTDQTPQQEGDLVNISDIVPADPSSLPVSSIADRYTRSMLKCLVGYPLYDPKPFSDLSKEYPRNGVNVGDVGFVRGNGTFDFLFNICPPHNDLINPPELSDVFSLETPNHSVTRHLEPLPRNTSLFQSPITRTNSGEYICEGSEGAILELPEGAIEDEAVYIRPFEKLAARHGVQWYEHVMTRNRKISNGSLYLITSFTKCTQWGIAVFDRQCAPGQGLRFDKKISFPFGKSTSKYHWKGSRAFATRLANPNQGDAPNQCVFLRGYKITIRQDIFDNLCNDQPHGSGPTMSSSSSQAGSSTGPTVTRHRAWRIRGGGGTDPGDPNIGRLTGGSPFNSWTTKSTVTESAEVVLDANFDSSLVHPSDLINAALLRKVDLDFVAKHDKLKSRLTFRCQNLDAKVALTHDDVWCDLLRDDFPKLNYTTLIQIAQSYTSTVDEYSCVLLGKIPDSSNVLDGSSRPIRGAETPALQESIQSARDEGKPDISMLAQAFTTLRQQSVDWHSSGAGDERKPGISVPSQAPHSTRKPPSPLKSLTGPLKFLTIAATQKHTATVIFVHGLGDTGRGLIPVADILKTDPGLSHVKWVLPDSPRRPVTTNADMVIPSWSDVYNFGFDGTEDEAGMLQTSKQLNDLITAEVNAGIAANRVVLGGFSQGGAMSLLTGLTCARKLGGIAVLSGWLPLYRKIKNMMSPHATSIPIFWGHGTADTIVKYDHYKKMCRVFDENLRYPRHQM